MKQKIKKCEERVSPIATILMIVITFIMAVIIPIFTFSVGTPSYFYIETEKLSNEDFLLVKTISIEKLPLTDVTLKVFEHGGGRFLSGPYTTNEYGNVIIQIPKGYKEYYDIVGEYNGLTMTYTIDNRALLVRSENNLGNLGIGLVISFVGIAAAVIGWFLKGWIDKKRSSITDAP
ncbi:hypothetical protein ANME2D_02198 [Candidatus Methanoperedens nitroreducens]|uniref:Archaeal Type IV pilin N-terminal domain-containing protein n=1 Tax=Candidatus Methanoperedens nitratireducens TaxID=1392998 RepID=A0A062V4F8_9EURY|nr:hypothetical protein [Candidatus Methanoperedens nitroreducens]KCZ71468.1 hypothetical protein ANME2D_02198 [Candidatus Methanoperedens nitroreducens]MDJ1421097.1 hypothetical protein [Candidatus Methanoperedens sp.]